MRHDSDPPDAAIVAAAERVLHDYFDQGGAPIPAVGVVQANGMAYGSNWQVNLGTIVMANDSIQSRPGAAGAAGRIYRSRRQAEDVARDLDGIFVLVYGPLSDENTIEAAQWAAERS
jgi:hypothetical protein